MVKVAILGAGQIGRAVFNIIADLMGEFSQEVTSIKPLIVDVNEHGLQRISKDYCLQMDLGNSDVTEISKMLMDREVTHVINALPFFLNEKVATAAVAAKCHYIDFTEDDIMADRVQELYKDTNLSCAVKCGLAPGFINYVGHKLVKEVDIAESLMISVGALPRTVSFSGDYPELSYNLTWSVDGLVNEYIRPCRVRMEGKETEVYPLSYQDTVNIDGFEYEAACTSGGVGSLVKELKDVPNVCYKTLRYPGHYAYIRSILVRTSNFEDLKEIFKKVFPTTNDDVIVVYAQVMGERNREYTRRTYANKFYGVNGLTGIQATTAGSGVAILELMLTGKVTGLVNHSNVTLDDFTKTMAFRKYYSSSK